MPQARLFRVIVPVSDIDEAAAWYAAVLDTPGRRISPGRHYFGCGGCILACFDPRADGDPWDARANPDHVYFAVDELEEYFRRVKQQTKGSIGRPIETQPWGERSFYCSDPFGNKLCFVDEAMKFTGGADLDVGAGTGRGRPTPYGVYDVAQNTRWVSVGVDHDTAAFAAQSIRRWWESMGAQAYPEAGKLPITADSGASNGASVRLWKTELQKPADETGLEISVCHLLPEVGESARLVSQLREIAVTNGATDRYT